MQCDKIYKKGVKVLEQINKLKKQGYTVWIFLLCAVLAGGFHEYAAALIGATLLTYTAVVIFKNKKISFNINAVSIAVLLITVFYLLSSLWAVDRGMAFIGFVKFLPVPVFMLMLMQDKGEKEKLVGILVPFAFVITLISVPLMFVPALDGIFSVADRLAGPFQYPNVMALFLLVCEILVVSKEKYKLYDFFCLAVFIIGIYLTGSRSVFVLALISNIAAMLMKNSKKVRLVTITVTAAVIISVIGLAVFTDIPLFDRLIRFSFLESTFAGRLLYFRDALPLILKRPFGMGYMGYYYIQQSIQTGVYSVMSVHNDFIQLLLDVGWVPAVAFIGAVLKGLFSKRICGTHRLIIATVSAHLCFDFDLQFVFMFMLLLLFFDLKEGKEIKIHGAWLCVCLAAVSIYMSLSLFLCRIGLYEAGLAMYPLNTQAQTQLLLSADSIEESNSIADKILERNEYITVAYSAKARYYYQKGDFGKVIENKNNIFEKSQFATDEYKEYCYMLINGISLYSKNGDTYSMRICSNELINAADNLSAMKEKLSYFGKIIKDQPDTELEEEVLQFIDTLRK